MSTKSGRPPQEAIQFAEAKNDMGDVRPTSSAPTHSAKQASWRARLPFDTMTQCLAPQRSHKARSSTATKGPWVNRSDRRTEETASISSSVMLCSLYGIDLMNRASCRTAPRLQSTSRTIRPSCRYFIPHTSQIPRPSSKWSRTPQRHIHPLIVAGFPTTRA